MDFHVVNHFTIWQFIMLTDRARAWAEEHIPEEAFMGSAFVAEARYVSPIVEGILADGLTME